MIETNVVRGVVSGAAESVNRKQSPVGEAAERLEAAIGRLHGVIGPLAEKLAPVLADRPAEGDDRAGLPQPGSSVLVGTLADMTARVDVAVERILTLTDRVEL